MESMSFLEQSTTINKEDNVFNGLVKSSFSDLENEDYFFFISRLPNGKNFLIDYMEEILSSVTDLEKLEMIVYSYVRVFSMEEVTLKLLAYHSNIRVRAYFMIALANEHASEISKFYPNIEEYLVNKDENGDVVEIVDKCILSQIKDGLLSDAEYNENVLNRLEKFTLDNFSQSDSEDEKKLLISNLFKDGEV